jgi:hypothetical protein
MVYPFTKKIIAEAREKYKAYENYCAYLEKKVDSFCNRKLEKKRLKREISEELKRTHTERLRHTILEVRNRGVERFSSRNSEEDFAEMDKLTETLKPSEQKVYGLFDKIEELNIDRDKKQLLEEVDVAQSLFEEVVWKLTEAQFYETAQQAETTALTEEYYKLNSKERECWMIPDPEKGGKDLELWNTFSWKQIALDKFVEYREKYFRNLEKLLESQKVTES